MQQDIRGKLEYGKSILNKYKENSTMSTLSSVNSDEEM